MPSLDDQDIPAMLDAFGEPVTLGATTVSGLVDRVGVEVLAGRDGPDLTSNRITVTVKTGSLPGLASNVTIAVGGVAYLVRERLPLDDGAFTQLHCARGA